MLSCEIVNFLTRSTLLLHLEIYVIIVFELAATWTKDFYRKIKNGSSFSIGVLVSLALFLEI